MLKVRSIGGKCEDCGGHVELRVTSWYETHRRQLTYFAMGFLFGSIAMYLWIP